MNFGSLKFHILDLERFHAQLNPIANPIRDASGMIK